MSEWFAMNGYARYVWPSVAAALIALVWNALRARSLLKQARAEVRRRLASEDES
ncbi:MAG: heme exporter protein CcmD [Steroidobacteraceae bacterium]